MTTITVDYLLDESDIERLEILKQHYVSRGYNLTVEQIFRDIMLMGCKWNIDDKLAYAENILGINDEADVTAPMQHNNVSDQVPGACE